MDRGGVMLVLVGCLLIAAGGALTAIKNAQEHEEATPQTDDQDVPTAPRQNSEPVLETPLIEPVPTPTPPQNEPTPNQEVPAELATATGSGAPNGRVELGSVFVSGDIANSQQVIANMSVEFRRCYNDGLKTNATMKGSLRAIALIGKNGEVIVANPAGGTGLSKEVIDCVVARVKREQFSPPPSGAATLVIPITFSSP